MPYDILIRIPDRFIAEARRSLPDVKDLSFGTRIETVVTVSGLGRVVFVHELKRVRSAGIVRRQWKTVRAELARERSRHLMQTVKAQAEVLCTNEGAKGI